MINAKRIVTIVGTLVCALGTGFVMQNVLQTPEPARAPVQVASANATADIASLTAATPETADAPIVEASLADAPVADAPLADTPLTDAPLADAPLVDEPVLDLGDLSDGSAVPVPPTAAPQPEVLPNTVVTLAALSDEPISELPQEVPAPSFACEIKMIANPTAGAMVELFIDAPCLINERVTIHHSGLMFSIVTDQDGLQSVTVPALSEAAVFIATFASGDNAVAKAEVSSVEYYDRAVVQWGGPGGLQIHAMEFGADYDEDGHVWSGQPNDVAAAAAGEGGFITMLGDATVENALMAEVYTFPSGTALREGEVALSLEIEVNDANCGQDIEAQTLQKSGLGQMQARDILLAMPDCDGVGDFLVLKNLFDDLNIARN